MAEQGLPANLPIFNTEAGILPQDFQAHGSSHVFGAGFLARTYLINWAGEGRLCCVVEWALCGCFCTIHCTTGFAGRSLYA